MCPVALAGKKKMKAINSLFRSCPLRIGPIPAYNPDAPRRPSEGRPLVLLETSVPATAFFVDDAAEADGEDDDDDEMFEGQQEEVSDFIDDDDDDAHDANQQAFHIQRMVGQ